MAKNFYDLSLALAGVTQATSLVLSLAQDGKIADEQAYNTSLNSLFNTNPKKAIDVYGDNTENLRYGVTRLKEFLSSKQSADHLTLGRLMIGIFFVEKRLQKRKDLLKMISDRLIEIQQQFDLYPLTHENTLAKLDALYQETISTFNFKVVINGEQSYLQNPAIVHKIRALLLSAVRSVVLWRQLGGSRLTLLFSRKKILCELDNFLTK